MKFISTIFDYFWFANFYPLIDGVKQDTTSRHSLKDKNAENL